MRVRAITFIVALCALALVPTSAFAAKKPQLRFSAPTYSVVEGNTTATITVQRTGNRTPAVDVQYSTSVPGTGTTATPGADYTAIPATTLHFNSNQSTRTFTVTILDDGSFDPNETIRLNLANATAGAQIKTAAATLTIVDNDGPGTIDFSSASYNTVEGAGFATISVTRQGATNISVSALYTVLAGGTAPASAASDFTPTAAPVKLTWAVGETTKTFQVPILDDSNAESPETVSLALSNPVNESGGTTPAIGPNSPAILTIQDEDVSTYAFSQSAYSIDENANPLTRTITVTRGGATNIASSVNYTTGNGSATAPGDYAASTGVLNFAIGETSKTFDVTVVNDIVQESNETVDLTLTQGLAGPTLATAILSIVDNDNPLASVQLSDVAYTVAEGAGSLVVTVTLSHQMDGDVTVDYALADTGPTTNFATGAANQDYGSTGGTVTFAGLHDGGPGQTSKTITIPITQDVEVEGDETFTVTLSNVSPVTGVLGTPASAVATITDDDDAGLLEFSSLRYDVTETGGQAVITVRRVGGSVGAVAVDYMTSDGQAAAGFDYTTATGTLNFADGETTKTFNVPVTWDGLAEGDETVNLSLANACCGSDLGTNVAAVLHIADDGASGPVQFSASNYDVNESAGSVTVTVTRSGGSLGGPVTVDYATADGTATAGSDYSEMHGTLTFGANETTKTFEVPISADTLHEETETIALTLSNPAGGTSLGSPATAAITIADDDAPPASDKPATEQPAAAGTPATGPQSTPANPDPAGSQTAAADKVAPKLTLSAKKLQRALKAKVIVIKVRSNEAAKLALTGKVFKGKKGKSIGKSSAKVAKGKTVTIKLKLSKKALAAITKALAKGKASITLTVVATDAAGNKGKAARKLSVK